MKRLALIALLLAAGCPDKPPVTGPPPIQPCDNAVHVWGNDQGAYHLPHNNLRPVLNNESNYSPDVASWNALGTPVALSSSGPGFQINVVNAGDKDSGWLGLASVNITAANHIISCTVSMNLALLAKYDSAVAEHVLCQEIGHCLGLDHQRGADDSCMDDCQGRSNWLGCLSSQAGTTPNTHDGEQLDAIYEHAGPKTDPEPPACTGEMLIHQFPDNV